MKSFLIILVSFVVISCNGCEKNNTLKSDMVGSWQENDGDLQFVIRNTENIGNNLKYLEIDNEQGRFLRQTIGDKVTLYKIINLSKYELVVANGVDTVAMHKIADL